MYRLYVDEVGSDSLTHLQKDKHRYLSLTGVALRIDHARDVLKVNIGRLKADIFGRDPDEPFYLHRTDILGYKGPFQALRSAGNRDDFNNAIMQIFTNTDYKVITALIDKKWMVQRTHWMRDHPYHYLLEILVEKYVQFLERQDAIGDIMPESRQKKDRLLQAEYDRLRADGCDFVAVDRIESRLPGSKLKFRKKPDEIAGLELCDLIAHPSHILVRAKMGHDVNLGPFSTRVCRVLWAQKYDRSPYNGDIMGYGIKHLPR